MSLKRKASFSNIASANINPFAMATAPEFNDTTRHLHSRTRKRFRNDRPDDQTVYRKFSLSSARCSRVCVNTQAENTLRLLFSGQKQPMITAHSFDEAASEAEISEAEIPDPRQQKLRRFFLPTQPSSSMDLGLTNQKVTTASSFGRIQNDFPDAELSVDSATSGSTTPYSEEMEMDVPMDIEADNGNHRTVSDAKTWVGGIGWM
jgi:hypothetical protein